MNLKNAVALVTGGGSGLGEATVREFAAAGDEVLREGDILELAGSSDAIAAARRLLETTHAHVARA